MERKIMSANPKRSTGKSKRRWKALQARGEWIPKFAVETLGLKGNWDYDMMRCMMRDLDHCSPCVSWSNASDPTNECVDFSWMDETLLYGVGMIKVTGDGAIVTVPVSEIYLEGDRHDVD
jgi:hypothetical protein